MTRFLYIILLAVTVSRGEPKISFSQTIHYENDISGQQIEITISQGRYDFSGHRISGGENFPVDQPPKDFKPATIDGIELAGTDGMNPFQEGKKDKKAMETITEITLKWGDSKVIVPKALHINLMGLTLDRDPSFRKFQFVPNAEGDAILFQATGGDGGASYMVSLILRKDGKHQQVLHGYWEEGLPSEQKAWNIAFSETAHE